MKRVPPSDSTDRARRLRADATDAERALWRLLREAFPQARFRRQVPIRHYIADFASHREKLVIEADGGQHHEGVDAARTAVIEAEGYRVLRFWNNDILGTRRRRADDSSEYAGPSPSSSPALTRAAPSFSHQGRRAFAP